MKIREALEIINRMEADGIINRYAIGGAVGATFYLEPVAPLNIDIFIAFRPGSDRLMIDMKPINEYLAAQGGIPEGEYIQLVGWPVLFLPAAGPLVEEALDKAMETEVEGTFTRVFSAEYLAAIALQAGRAKDKARLLQFFESGVLEMACFRSIVLRHGLEEAWQRFERQFLGDQS